MHFLIIVNIYDCTIIKICIVTGWRSPFLVMFTFERILIPLSMQLLIVII